LAIYALYLREFRKAEISFFAFHGSVISRNAQRPNVP
jgi:hypothetical protein